MATNRKKIHSTFHFIPSYTSNVTLVSEVRLKKQRRQSIKYRDATGNVSIQTGLRALIPGRKFLITYCAT